MSAEAGLPSMRAHRHYHLAPIVEAVVQLSFAEPTSLSSDAVNSLVARFGETYPKRRDLYEQLYELQANLQVDSGTPELVKLPTIPHGVQLEQVDGHRLVRIAAGAISVHENKVYQGWDSFRDYARQFFSECVAAATSSTIARVGVRYINRIDIPADGTDLRTWVVSSPEIPEGMTQMVATYAFEMVMPQPDLPGVTATVRQALVPSSDPAVAPIILDIDVVSTQLMEFQDVWPILEELHDRENLIFECNITNKTRGIFS